MRSTLLIIFLMGIILLCAGCVSIDPRSLDAPPSAPVVALPIPSTAGGNTAPISTAPDPTTAPPTLTPPTPSTPPSVSLPPVPTVIVLTPAEIAKHSTKRDCWAIYSGSVYDISSFTTHPGGNVYVPYCGKDMTRAFNQQGHSTRAENLLASFFLGTLNSTISVSSASG